MKVLCTDTLHRREQVRLSSPSGAQEQCRGWGSPTPLPRGKQSYCHPIPSESPWPQHSAHVPRPMRKELAQPQTPHRSASPASRFRQNRMGKCTVPHSCKQGADARREYSKGHGGLPGSPVGAEEDIRQTAIRESWSQGDGRSAMPCLLMTIFPASTPIS